MSRFLRLAKTPAVEKDTLECRVTFPVVAEDAAKKPERINGTPMVLRPIAWGERDAALARVTFQHLVEANPPIVIPFNPITETRLRRTLRHLGVFTL